MCMYVKEGEREKEREREGYIFMYYIQIYMSLASLTDSTPPAMWHVGHIEGLSESRGC